MKRTCIVYLLLLSFICCGCQKMTATENKENRLNELKSVIEPIHEGIEVKTFKHSSLYFYIVYELKELPLREETNKAFLNTLDYLEKNIDEICDENNLEKSEVFTEVSFTYNGYLLDDIIYYGLWEGEMFYIIRSANVEESIDLQKLQTQYE